MDNANMPANPATLKNDKDYIKQAQGVGIKIEEWTSHAGLTKREHFASMAMQGSLAGDINDELTVDDIAIQARQCADALLKELSK